MLGLGLGVDKIRPSGVLPLLDLYPATAAYSLRALSSSTTNVVKVREDGLNQEQDFTADEITDGTLASFCGANNGFVVTWYDQAGSNDATQATAGSQPKIYDSSTGVVLENGKPAVGWDGSNDLLEVTLASVLAQPNSISIVHKFNTTIADNCELVDSNPNERTLLDVGTSTYRIFAGTVADSGIANNTNQRLAFAIYNAASSSLHVDGVGSTGLNPSTNGLGSYAIGFTRGVNNSLNGVIQELIIYNSDQSANRTAIESNINSHYNIYS